MQETIFDFIDTAGDDGYYAFNEPQQYAARHAQERSKKDKLRQMVRCHFYGHHLFTGHLDTVKKWVTDIDTTAVVDAQGSWHVRLNLARFFMLPGVNPKAELGELRGFFEALKPFFEENSARRPGVTIVNNRNRNGAVFGSLKLSAGAGGEESCKQHIERLEKLVAQSDVLQHFMRQQALSLQKLGPWSWAHILENQLYGHMAGPFAQHVRRQREAKAA